MGRNRGEDFVWNPVLPHSNTDFWKKKIERNRLRDERNKAELKKMEPYEMAETDLRLAGEGETAYKKSKPFDIVEKPDE